MSENPRVSDPPASAIKGAGYRGSIPWGPAVALLALAAVLRCTNLMQMPIFCDEAIYLRWAQMIHQKPLLNAWISLIDPKPPLHYWLMAALWDTTTDPLRMGRAISIVTALLMIPALLALARDLELLFHGSTLGLARRDAATLHWPAPSGRLVGLIACLLTIVCPYLAFNQRLALADGPFVFESVLAAWASVRLALAIRNGVGFRRGLLVYSLPLGIIMGLTMLTRQNVSYVLWALPVMAVLLFRQRGPKPQDPATGSAFRRAAFLLVASALIGTALWSPFLLAQPGRYRTEPDATGNTQPQFAAELKRRILYQQHFSNPMTLQERASLARKNFISMFIPAA